MNQVIELLRQQELLNNRLVSHTFELLNACDNVTSPEIHGMVSQINTILHADDKSSVDLIKLTVNDKQYYVKMSEITEGVDRLSIFYLNRDLADLEFAGTYHDGQITFYEGGML